MTNPLFYAKILLFGEYGIIEDSQGLTLPYSFYKGTLKFSDLSTDFEKQSNEHLLNYSDELLGIDLPAGFEINISALKDDIAKGLYFDSNIPQGYGVGSSGALVAAIFEKYSIKKYNPESISKEDLKELKKVFGLLESYFHGKSSGIDPLICYMNLPILIENRENVDKVMHDCPLQLLTRIMPASDDATILDQDTTNRYFIIGEGNLRLLQRLPHKHLFFFYCVVHIFPFPSTFLLSLYHRQSAKIGRASCRERV